MSILSFIGLSGILWMIYLFFTSLNSEQFLQKASRIKSIGTLALVFGILGQFIGLYSAFATIEKMGAVSPEILAGGLRVSSITTIYGLIIFIICYLLWLISYAIKKSK